MSRATAYLLLVVLAACNMIADLDDLRFVPTESSGGGQAGGTAAGGGTQSSSSAGAMGGTPATTGGGGGASGDCGNGTIDSGEQCDDGGATPGDGCDQACQVECGTIFDMTTLHCYVLQTTPQTWDDARADCQALGPGWDFAALTDDVEMTWLGARPSVVAQHMVDSHIWVGGSDAAQEGTWIWTNGEPVPMNLWLGMEPNNLAPGQNCSSLWYPNQLGLADSYCSDMHASICERAPAGS